MSGVPLPKAALGTASNDELLAVLSPRETLSAGELSLAIMRTRSAALDVFVDPFRARVWATEDLDMLADFLTAHNPTAFLRCEPDTTGLLSKWSIVDSANWSDQSAFFHAQNRRALSKVVDAFVRIPGDVFAIASQGSGDLLIFTPNSGEDAESVSDTIAASVAVGWTCCFELVERARQNLPFE